MEEKAELPNAGSSTPPPESEDNHNPSVQLLKGTAELSDITKRDMTPERERNVTDSELKIELSDPEKRGGNSIETLYENAGIDKTVSSVTTSKTGAVEKPAEISNTQMSAQSGRMNKLRDQASSIFPAGIMGCKDNDDTLPSPRRFLDAGQAQQDNIGHIDHMPRKMTGRNDHGRNPLLMTGMDEDDKKKKGTEGVDVKVTGGSTTHIPPGGYSHGLW